jgi:hypothetical protein
MFFIAVGILAWLFALSVLWIFTESGGALAVIAAGIFAGLAIVSLGLERILKLLEDIRDGAAPRAAPTTQTDRVMSDHVNVHERDAATPRPAGAIPA